MVGQPPFSLSLINIYTQTILFSTILGRVCDEKPGVSKASKLPWRTSTVRRTHSSLTRTSRTPQRRCTSYKQSSHPLCPMESTVGAPMVRPHCSQLCRTHNRVRRSQRGILLGLLLCHLLVKKARSDDGIMLQQRSNQPQ